MAIGLLTGAVVIAEGAGATERGEKKDGAGEKLPRVLILGDSISIGYTPFVKKGLAGKAEVSRPERANGRPENCQGTNNGVKQIDRWIGATDWAVIHFNFGLHDLKHVHPETGKNSADPDHPRQAEPEAYERQLDAITARLKKTGATLIFANTTPYPDKPSGPLRRAADVARYNAAALRVMKRHGVAINDLHAAVLPRLAEWQQPNNVHFKPQGSKALGAVVARAIADRL